MEKFHVIIPARYASTRLKGKVLIDIAGKPMIQHVYERAIQSGASSVVIATCDEEVVEVVKSFGAQYCVTNKDHKSGTSRLSEAVKILNYPEDAIIVNVQGDEPLIPPIIINQVAANLSKFKKSEMATLCERILSIDDLLNPNIVKVILNKEGNAIYFSRAPIPWERDNFAQNPTDHIEHDHYRHIGIFAYRVNFLQKYVKWEPSPLEISEKLEQLRILWHGANIHVELAKESPPLSVDTASDLEKIRLLMTGS